MDDAKIGSWAEGELRELLCLMMIGVCLWLAGTQLGWFARLLEFTVFAGLGDLFMLGLCMSVGVTVAAILKSLKLRRVMEARDGAQAQAESVARHDALTGLANRRLFKETLDERLAHGAGGAGIAVLLIDLDRFKPVNDVHGHAAGDAVLCFAADCLRALTPQGGTAARLGGDEFAVLLDDRRDRDPVRHGGLHLRPADPADRRLPRDA